MTNLPSVRPEDLRPSDVYSLTIRCSDPAHRSGIFAVAGKPRKTRRDGATVVQSRAVVPGGGGLLDNELVMHRFYPGSYVGLIQDPLEGVDPSVQPG